MSYSHTLSAAPKPAEDCGDDGMENFGQAMCSHDGQEVREVPSMCPQDSNGVRKVLSTPSMPLAITRPQTASVITRQCTSSAPPECCHHRSSSLTRSINSVELTCCGVKTIVPLPKVTFRPPTAEGQMNPREVLNSIGRQTEKLSKTVLNGISDVATVSSELLGGVFDVLVLTAGIEDCCKQCTVELAASVLGQYSLGVAWGRMREHHHVSKGGTSRNRFLGEKEIMSASFCIFVKALEAFLGNSQGYSCCAKHDFINSFSKSMLGVPTEFYCDIIDPDDELCANGEMEESRLFSRIGSLFSALNPITPVSSSDFHSAAMFARDLTALTTTAEKVIVFATRTIQRMLKFIQGVTLCVEDTVAQWVIQVEELVLLYDNEAGGLMTLREKMNRFQPFRDKIRSLHVTGKLMLTKYQLQDTKSVETNLLKEKMAVLNKIMSDNASSFIGGEGKKKPLFIFLHGEQGVGKTIAVDHLMTDLLALEGRTYNPGQDKFNFNPDSEYFDQYKVQTVFELQDFFQSRDRTVRNTEASNLIKITDESAFPLNIAFEGKGTVYFASEIVVVTSNLDPVANTAPIADILECHKAFLRRIDVLARVNRTRDSECFDRDAMEFTIVDTKSAEQSAVPYTWDEFVAMIALTKRNNLAKSNAMRDLGLTYSEERIQRIKGLMENQPPPKLVKMPKKAPESFALNVSCVKGTECGECRWFEEVHYGYLFGTWKLRADHKAVLRPGQHCCDEQCKKNTRYCRHCGDKKNTNHACEAMLATNQPLRTSLAHAQGQVDDGPPLDPLPSTSWTNPGRVYSSNDLVEELRRCETRRRWEGQDIQPPHERWLDQQIMARLDAAVTRAAGLDNMMIDAIVEAVKIPVMISVCAQQPMDPENEQAAWKFAFAPSSGNTTHYRHYIVSIVDGQTQYKIENVLEWDQAFFKTYFEYLQWRITYNAKRLTAWLTKTAKSWYEWLKDLASSFVDRWIARPMMAAAFWEAVREVRDKVVKWFLPVLSAIGLFLAGCATWFTVGKLFSGNEELSAGQLSEDLLRVRKKPQTMRGPPRRPHNMKVTGAFGEVQPPFKLEDYVAADGAVGYETGDVFMNNIRPNIGLIKSQRGTMCCVALCEKVIAFTEHLVGDVGDELFAVFPGGANFSFKLEETDCIVCPETHLTIVDLSRVDRFKKSRVFPSIMRYLVEKPLDHYPDGFLLVAANFANSMVHVIKLATDIDTSFTRVNVKVKAQASPYSVDSCISYNAYTVQGDCTAPVIALNGNKVEIVGFHCARIPGGRTYAGAVTREWMAEVMKALRTQAQGQMNPVTTMFVSPVTYEEPKEVKVHHPRKSKLVRSEFCDEDPALLPSALKGTFDGKTPCQISFEKSVRPLVSPDPEKFVPELEWLEEVYASEDDKKVLTVEEAVLGTEGIPPMASDTSPGYPWMLNYKRKDLFDVENKTISQVLTDKIESVWEDIRSQERAEFEVIDMLKDEKLPAEKAKAGKARLFFLLPLDINIVLKQLFGKFCQHVVDLHQRGPCKVGISVSEDDVHALADFLLMHRNDVKYACLDVAASDRVIPFEVFMTIVQLADQWYGDNYSKERYALARSIFAPVHNLHEMRYRTAAGMPSGCYLTSVFNSLAYALVYKHIFRILKYPLLTIATFGDDSVIVTEKDMPGQLINVAWEAQKLGLDLTPAEKQGTFKWDLKQDVQFLQRKFVKRAGCWYFPRSERSIEELMKWYRRTSETCGWSLARIHEELLVNAFTEFYHHGKKVFKKMLVKYEDAIRKYEAKIPTYDEFAKIYLESQDNPLGCLAEPFDPTYGHFSTSDLFAEGHVKDSDPTATSETVLGEATITRTTENLTQFVDTRIAQESCSEMPRMPTLDASFQWERAYCQALERWVKLDDTELNTALLSTPVARLNPLVAILNERYVNQRFYQAVAARFDIEFEIRVVATRFHYGQLMAVLRPALFQNQATLNAVVTENPRIAQMVQKEWGAWDSIYTASQNKHEVISITQGAPVTMCMKWHYPYNWVPTFNIACVQEGKINHTIVGEILRFGMLDIYNLTGAYPTSMDKPHVVTWCRFKNLQLFGFQSFFPRLATLVYKKPAEDVAVGQMKEDEHAEMGQTWNTSYTWAAKLESLVVGTIRSFASVLAFFGLSNPRNEAGPTPMMMLPLNTATSCGRSPALSLSYRLDDKQASFMSEEDKEMMLYHKIAAIPSFRSTTTLTNSARAIAFVSNMNSTRRYGHGFVSPPAGYIKKYFAMARAGQKFYFQFCASAVVNARVRITIAPEIPTTKDVGSFYQITRVVDIQGDVLEVIEVPYFESTMYSLDGGSWRVVIDLVTDIISTEETESKPILMALWIAFTGAEYAVHSIPQVANTAFFDYLPGCYEKQSTANPLLKLGKRAIDQTPDQSVEYSDDEDKRDIRQLSLRATAEGQIDDAVPAMVGKISEGGQGHGLNSSPTSVLHSIKRLSSWFADTTPGKEAVTVRPTRPAWFSETGENPRHYVKGGIFHFMSWMFKYYHGGTNVYRHDQSETAMAIEATFDAGDQPLNPVTVESKNWELGGGVIYAGYGGRAALIHIPYRALVPYTFTEIPLYGTIDSGATAPEWSYGTRYGQLPYVSNMGRFSFSAAEDFEMFGFMGCPSTYRVPLS
nr:hypothetical protein [Cryptolin calicivirus 1]